MAEPKTFSHILSKKVDVNRLNTFVWSTSIPRMAVALNLHRRSHVTSRTLYRWLPLIAEYCVWNHDYRLYPVEVRPHEDFLRYEVKINGDEIPPESDYLISPGDYGIFKPGKTPVDPPIDTRSVPSFLYIVNDVLRRKYATVDDILYNGFEKGVRARDPRCIITGKTDGDLEATWIVPPLEFLFIYREDRDDSLNLEFPLMPGPNGMLDIKPLQSVRNGLLMHPELARLFEDNSFSIDIDDNYRIVFFKDPSDLLPTELLDLIPTHCYIANGTDGHLPSTYLLRKHFIMSLRVNCCGADLRCELTLYDLREFFDWLDERGYQSDAIDPHWESNVGAYWVAWQSMCKRLQMIDGTSVPQEA
ncbi:uncharacterized protein LAESUDRAFT_814571 [Laetiporus sulphureus 93-53]|uniref:HNH nuclease domain-containing protein n=1 Tax=Laetiporus sulphureus 93-53 TaxID=1314785 RepID=A0A165CY54_9APHY|nr:uncharacterized protein LAESUDRAFT_814571 [Laetiporus sulphureus 93-53]KZT03724.1 hypothetical protein LAESUDRAFT_814571 [Laetiporus sulphureus 93-53]